MDRPPEDRKHSAAVRRMFIHPALGWLRFVAYALVLCSGLSTGVNAFVFLTSPPTVWLDDTIPMTLQLGTTLAAPLSDGSTSYNAVAENVVALWNQHIATVKFTTSRQNQKAPENGDGINQVSFDSSIYGESFGDDVLAVTTRWSIGTTRVESDIIFNSTKQWDSYRGALRLTDDGNDWLYDFQRVALHEFGHSLGLGHPDEAGQRVLSVMNSSISDLDHLSSDDVLGATSLYGGAPLIVTDPRSQNVTAGAKAEFNVVARGLAPLKYQWLFETAPINGATNAVFSIERVQSSHAGIYAVVVSNSQGSVQSAPATLAIDQGTAFGVVGVPFSYQIVANNNSTWYTASGLPPGLTCSGSTGLILGIPKKAGTFLMDVSARNQVESISATISVTIDEGVIISPIGVAGVIGVPFIYQIVADNNPTWHSVSGLPSGLTYDGRTGLISGIPNRIGTFYLEVTARNQFASISTNVFFVIDDGAITSPDSAQGIIGMPFRYQISSDNNPTWYSASGLPSGLICRGSTGLVAGTPKEAGTFLVEVIARNQFASTSATIAFTIDDGTINPNSLPKIDFLRRSDGFFLAWPVTSDGFVLEEAPAQPNSWTNSPAKVVIQGSQKMVVIPATGGAKFYRLRKSDLEDAANQ
jgi:hypothetical protein